jgi:hypothetical protein
MSDIPRYRPVSNDKYGITDDADGKLCEYRDYARLKAEVDNLRKSADINTDESTHELSRLKAEVERLTAFTTCTIIPNELLQAEVERLTNNCKYLDQKLDEELDNSAMLCGQVERLTKAGDAMAEELVGRYFGKRLINDWNAAKEGKPRD